MKRAASRVSSLVRAAVVCGAGLLAAVGCAPPPTATPSIPSASAADQARPRIELWKRADGAPAGFAVVDLSAEELRAFEHLDDAAQRAALCAYVVSDLVDPPPMGGELTVEDGAARFMPRFALEPGMSYRVEWRGAAGDGTSAGQVLAERFEIPRSKREPTRVTQIYPTSDRLPENQLKFYIHFSAPMGRGDAYRHIHLRRDDGREVEAAFLELGEELWDPDQRRFTLLCDPGRVKRGLKPREELGPVLEEGHDYTLVVDRDWRDAAGQPLAEAAVKKFHVLAPDDAPIDPAAWKLTAPPAGTRDALEVRFPEPLDHALLERVVWVASAGGERLAGTVEIDEHETRWRFTPAASWPAGDYQLVADTALEDLGANAIGRPFDVDVFAPVSTRIESETISQPFTVREAVL